MTQYFERQDYDEVAIRNAMTATDVIQSLTLEDVYHFLLSLGLEERDIDCQDTYLICPTICHNALDEATSMKLYYYDANKSFHCYTQCSENFNIIELYRRYMEINHYAVPFYEAEEYVRQFVGVKSEMIKPKEHYSYGTAPIHTQDFITLPCFDEGVLDCFSNYYHPLWKAEGISEAAMEQFKIKFSIEQNKIVIPHYDINGRLIGIRGRAIEEKDLEFGKYRPITIGTKMYNHQLGFNLYGIWENQAAIRRAKTAVIFEGEKSVLLSNSYFGEYSIAVATCGSQLNRFQINLLIKKLGVNDIILAYDKEFKDLSDPKCRIYRQKLIDKCTKYRGLASFYYLFDERNLLKQKDSPIDEGQEIYQTLMKKRIKIK